MAARSIDRIPLPDVATFFRDYVATRRPVIITNLFEGDPIRQVRTRDEAVAAFGRVALRIQPEYIAAAAAPTQAGPRTMSLADYCAHVAQNAMTELVCAEYEIPAAIMAQFRLPRLCLASDLEAPEVFGLPKKYGDHDLLLNMFLANRGNRAHLHYDGDHRHVLLYQVFGRKEVILFQPEQGMHLKPIDGLVGFSGLFLERMSPEQKRELVDAAGGYLAVLEPGEAIYMPLLIWHYLEYLDDAMSINVRFGRNPAGRFLAVDNCHRDYYVQNYGSRLANIDRTPRLSETLSIVAEEYLQPADSQRSKVASMRAQLKRLCTEVCPDAKVEEYCPPHREAGEIDKVMADIGATMRYADPATIIRTRPHGPVAAAQKRHIEDGARKRGWPDGVLPQILANRVGKQDLDALTQADAAQVLSYLRSPGAVWA